MRRNRDKRVKDKKITILKKVIEENDIGVQIETTIPFAENIWAYYRHASADEYHAAAQVNYKVEAIFEINWRDDIDNTMQILFRGKEYNITRIDDFEGYRDTLRLYAYTKD